MSKTAKAKTRQPSVHSRAARRAASPSLNIDKSLKNVTPPRSNPHSHLFTARDAGVRKKKNKQLKRGQLVRQRKGVERADVVKGQLDSKLQKSLAKLKTVKERAKDWDVVNGSATGLAQGSKFAALSDMTGEVEGASLVPMATEPAVSGNVMQIPVRSVQEQRSAEDLGAAEQKGAAEQEEWEDVVE